LNDIHFDQPIQTIRAVQDSSGINRSTIIEAIEKGLLGKSVYQSGSTWMIDITHADFKRWFQAHWQQARVKGRYASK
jgi:phage FluMu gp28-like protein